MHDPLVTVHGPLVTVHGPLVTVHSPLVSVHGPLVTVHGPLVTVHGPLLKVCSCSYRKVLVLQCMYSCTHCTVCELWTVCQLHGYLLCVRFLDCQFMIIYSV